ncbi:LytR/AlgR family response regulator transcription factor [Hufsiella ginkgonis]|uniref:Response regulator n=1 Tax=Hufsiella ginkgonis TaxID=2695274 RepID=A0A7K1Y125_9SPHI|nr:LytTR family DNA-binding domain-containing protein [Hufsiella ginkgonis]MXV16912.1 response regulator [Hufsiella ginkgonis]
MRLKCIVIDDEPLALQLIRNYVSKFPALELVKTFEDAISGGEYLAKHDIDLLFVDVNMPDITGVDLVRSLEKKPIIIFTTAYKNYAFESYELQALDYLLKPIDLKRFSAAVEKAVDYYKYKNLPDEPREDESIYVYSEYRMIKILLKDIEYIESMADYIIIHLAGSDKPVMSLMTLKKVLEKLPKEKFIRVHRSFIVSVNKIRSLHNRKIRLETIELPIGDAYNDVVNQYLKSS